MAESDTKQTEDQMVPVLPNDNCGFWQEQRYRELRGTDDGDAEHAGDGS